MHRYDILAVCLALYLVIYNLSCQTDSPITLIDHGKSDYSIVIAPTASPSEHYAAQEFQETIKKMTDCTLPILFSQDAPVKNRIFIGSCALSNSLISDKQINALAQEDFIIRTKDKDLFIIGGKRRGTMYGVFTFLEHYCDCRWYTADVIKIPAKSTLAIPAIEDYQKPAFEYRMPYFSEALDKTWATHNKINGYGADLPAQVGGSMKYAKGRLGHTFYALVPPEKYFHEHPEYFSLVNGKRVRDRGQLCLTNPDVLKIAIQEIDRWLQEDPQANIVSITQNDWEDWCECENCRFLDEKEQSHAATVVAFVNAIADSLGKKYPDIYFDTFAYTYSQKPPKTLEVRDNVIIRICHMNPCCDAHPLVACQRNADYVKHLKTWRTKGGKMYVWHYVTDFNHYLMPLPNFNAIGKDIPFYYQQGVSGVFCQGAAAPGGGGEWAELRSYVLAKLLWDPEIDIDVVIDDFMKGVYHEAAGYMRQYFNMMHEMVKDPEMHFDLYSHPDEVSYLNAETIKKAHAYFNQAEESVADQPEVLLRVQKARLPVYYADLWFQGQNQILLQQPVNQNMLRKFKDIIDKNGIIYQASTAKITSFYQFLSSDYQFIHDLKIIGPFDGPKESLLDTKLPPEYEIDFSKKYSGVNDIPISWQDWTKERGLYVDFTAAFDPDSIGVAYALCYVYSPKEFATKLGVGSNDGVRVFLNKEMIHNNVTLRKATPNSDIIPVTLRKGWNKVLVKVDQIGAGWGMYLSILDPDRILRFSTDIPE